MSSASPEDVSKEVKTYIRVFATLLVLTLVTVAASYLPTPVWLGIVIALIIAGVKGSLVAGFFMHLLHEHKATFTVLLMCIFFFLVLMLLPILDRLDSAGVS